MSLGSLIVQRGIASIREIEEAMARQVLYGGDFPTNLLEVSRVEESALMPVVAEYHKLALGPIGELPRAPAGALRMIASEVVAEHGFAPLEIGKALVIAVAEPLSAEVDQELTFALALPIEQRIVPRFRIRQALARDYGIPVDKRTTRLIAKIVQKGPRMPSAAPPPQESVTNLRVPPRPRSAAPPPMRVQAAVPAPQGPKGTFVRDQEGPPLRPLHRRRGPLTADVAKTELEASAERDVIFDLLFEFARQFFDYTALFIVHGDIAEGRDAFGDGASREKVARVGVPLDLDNILATARTNKDEYRGKPQKEGLDPVLMADLGRDGETECIVFPVVVRQRVVALVFGDGGPSGIDADCVRQVRELVDASAGAFERVIVRRKLKTSPPTAERGVERARMKAAKSIPAPPTQVSDVNEDVRGQRPSVEELAAPIQELMAEPSASAKAPPSAKAPAASEAPAPAEAPAVAEVPAVAEPPRESDSSRTLPAGEPLPRKPSDATAPDKLLKVRRPSGRPIPREEPESARSLPAPSAGEAPPRHPTPAGTAAAALSASAGAPPSVAAATPSGPKRTRSQQLRRAQAPELQFGNPKAPAAVVEEVGLDDITLVDAPVQSVDAPRTMRDPDGGAWGGSTPSQAPSPSSRAIAPPPLPPAARSRPSSTTLTSGIPMFPAVPNAGPRVIPEVIEVISPAASDLHAMPIVPAVDDTAPSSGPDPVLPLSQRKSIPSTSRRRKSMPASEQTISVPPHKPPSSRRPDPDRELPSIIVDTSSECEALIVRVLESADEEAESALLRAGAAAMPAIMAQFPGPIAIEPERLEGAALPRVAECGPIIRLVASQRRTALAEVLARVDSPAVETRFWATYLLTELIYPEAVVPAVARAFDEDARVRRAARAAVRALAEVHAQLVVDRLGEIAKNASDARRFAAIETLGESREPLAVAALLPILEQDAEGAEAARASLVLISQQDFGSDVDRWIMWWGENLARHRIEWLIDSLMHERRALRTSASEELRGITKEQFHYYDDLPKRERERAQARYREWWENVGRVRFSRAASRG